MFIVALFIVAMIWKQPACLPTNEWKKVRYYSAVRKKEKNPVVIYNMLGTREYYASEISQTEKQRYSMVSLACEMQIKKNSKS